MENDAIDSYQSNWEMHFLAGRQWVMDLSRTNLQLAKGSNCLKCRVGRGHLCGLPGSISPSLPSSKEEDEAIVHCWGFFFRKIEIDFHSHVQWGSLFCPPLHIAIHQSIQIFRNVTTFYPIKIVNASSEWSLCPMCYSLFVCNLYSTMRSSIVYQ